MSFYQRVLRCDCTICPPRTYLEDDVVPIFHKHFSGRTERMQYRDSYDCPPCARVHSPRISAPLPVCVGSGTLHEFWLPYDESIRFNGIPCHIDFVSVPGATVAELRTAFMAEYAKAECPLNVVLLPGYNDFLRGSEVPEVVQEIQMFKDLVDLQAYRCHPSSPNTFGVAAMPFAPRLCRLPGQNVTTSDFKNHFAQQRFLNAKMLQMNVDEGLPLLDFSRVGLRWDRNESGELVSRPDFSAWHGSNPRRMIHLNDRIRIRMAQQVGAYFEALEAEDWYH